MTWKRSLGWLYLLRKSSAPVHNYLPCEIASQLKVLYYSAGASNYGHCMQKSQSKNLSKSHPFPGLKLPFHKLVYYNSTACVSSLLWCICVLTYECRNIWKWKVIMILIWEIKNGTLDRLTCMEKIHIYFFTCPASYPSSSISAP